MKFRNILLIGLTGYILNIQPAFGQFVTKRLESLALETGVLLKDTTKVSVGCDLDSAFYFQNHPLHIKKNQYGEISHIGYSLFSKEMREQNPSAIYDFLERYILELDLAKSKNETKSKLTMDHVTYDGRLPKELVNADDFFKVNFETNHKYEVERKNGQDYFHIAFYADCQLMLGALEDELEKIMLKNIQRAAPKDSTSGDIILVFDRYGHEKDTLFFNRQKLIELIEDECEETVLRSKSETEEVLFAVNHQLGYLHMVSFKPGQARLYAYISIHNAPDSFINRLIPEKTPSKDSYIDFIISICNDLNLNLKPNEE